MRLEVSYFSSKKTVEEVLAGLRAAGGSNLLQTVMDQKNNANKGEKQHQNGCRRRKDLQKSEDIKSENVDTIPFSPQIIFVYLKSDIWYSLIL